MKKEEKKSKEVKEEKEVVMVKEEPKKVVEKPDYPTRSFLEHKNIKVTPVVRPGKWTMLTEESRNESYMYPKAKRSYTVPADMSRGGQLLQVLDNIDRYYTPQYPKEALTEQEFFQRQLDCEDLSANKQKNNFWMHDKRSKVVVRKDGLLLKLSDPLDYVWYKILKSNKDKIAFSWDGRFDRPSFEFALVDENIQATNKASENKLKDDAYEVYMGLKGSRPKLENYLKVVGKAVTKDMSEDFLRTEVAELRDMNPGEFIRVANDPNFATKVLMVDAVSAGALVKTRMGGYELASGVEIGDSEKETVSYLLDPKNIDIRKKIEYQIENSK